MNVRVCPTSPTKYELHTSPVRPHVCRRHLHITDQKQLLQVPEILQTANKDLRHGRQDVSDNINDGSVPLRQHAQYNCNAATTNVKAYTCIWPIKMSTRERPSAFKNLIKRNCFCIYSVKQTCSRSLDQCGFLEATLVCPKHHKLNSVFPVYLSLLLCSPRVETQVKQHLGCNGNVRLCTTSQTNKYVLGGFAAP